MQRLTDVIFIQQSVPGAEYPGGTNVKKSLEIYRGVGSPEYAVHTIPGTAVGGQHEYGWINGEVVYIHARTYVHVKFDSPRHFLKKKRSHQVIS